MITPVPHHYARYQHLAHAVAEPPGEQAETWADIAPEDWDLLFRAVLARLGSTLPGGDSPAAECMEALDQLRTTMTHLCAGYRPSDAIHQ
jgi:hypothetical protein